VQQLYPAGSIIPLFIDAFYYLPLVAILQNDIFCVHGGICPELKTLNQIKKILKPIFNFDNSIVKAYFGAILLF
jgi:diadenosine tetraphosphatase ApaH/serine/threonine PP2A family protein phosphatase